MKPTVERKLSLNMFLCCFFFCCLFACLVGFASTVCFLVSGMKAVENFIMPLVSTMWLGKRIEEGKISMG